MSADDVVTPTPPGPEPERYVTLPRWPEIYAAVSREWDYDREADRCLESSTHADLAYYGFLEDIHGAGVITAAMVTPVGKGKRYRDPDGRKVRIERRWKVREGEREPRQYLVVTRDHLHVDELHRWPMGLEALAAYDAHTAWRVAKAVFLAGGKPPQWTRAVIAHPAPAAAPTRAALRLVVDNTREARK